MKNRNVVIAAIVTVVTIILGLAVLVEVHKTSTLTGGLIVKCVFLIIFGMCAVYLANKDYKSPSTIVQQQLAAEQDEARFNIKIDHIGKLYEEGKDCLNNITVSERDRTELCSYNRTFEILKELRDMAATETQINYYGE